MKSLKFFSLVLFIFLAVYLFAVMSGCGIVQQGSSGSAFQVSTRSPILNATGVASSAALSVTFNHTINTSESTWQLGTPAGHTAGTWEGTPTFSWSNENKTLSIEGITGWSSGGATTVYLTVASTESFKDYSGNSLAAGTTLWKYVIASGGGQYAVSGTVSYAQDLDIAVAATKSFSPITIESYALVKSNSTYTLALPNNTYYIYAFYPTSGATSLIGAYGWSGSGGISQVTLDATSITVNDADLSDIDFGLYSTIEIPSIVSRSPALNATGVAQTADLSITFSVTMSPEVASLVLGAAHTAGNPSGTVTTTWSNGNKTITYSGITGWSGGAGTVVHVVSTTEGFQAISGAYLPAGLDIWKYTLAN